MSMETDCRYQKALLWQATGHDTYGEPTVSSTVAEIGVRWEYINREIPDARGNTVAVDVVAVVDRAVEMGSVLWLGGLLDLPSGSSTPTSDLRYVVRHSDISDIKGRNFRRLVYLARLSDEFPNTSD